MTDLRPATTRDIERARALRAAGFTNAAIARQLQARGVRAHRLAVAEWLDPALAARRQAQTRRSKGRRPTQRRVSEEYIVGRMEAWSHAGASCSAIARIAQIEFGVDFDRDQVRAIVSTGHFPRRYTRRTKEAA